MRILRYVGERNCTNEAYQSALADSAAAVVNSFAGQRNVTVRFYRDSKPLWLPADGSVRDLLDLAVAIYIADELVQREDMADGWTRDFEMIVPVADPDRWRGAERSLASALKFLAQDRVAFKWPERSELQDGVHHRATLPSGFDAVCLFSGGVDSLLGAYRLLTDGQKVLLVGHQAEPVTAKAQKDLARALRIRFPGQVSLIQCRVARAKIDEPRFRLPKKVEETHRPRSFLFLALAVAVARVAQIQHIYIPENGLIALNSPLDLSRVGTHSTRTAHPIFLTRLLDFLKEADLYMGEIRNPFLYVSKTDMLSDLDPSLVTLVQRSVSCSHPSRYQDEGVRHCGYCIPCLYRRAAMMAADLDRSAEYAFDAFSGRPSRVKKELLTNYKQADIRALVPFAQSVAKESDLELQSRILGHGYFPPTVGERIGPHGCDDYSPWTDMLRRWANGFLADATPRCSRAMRRVLGIAVPAKVSKL